MTARDEIHELLNDAGLRDREVYDLLGRYDDERDAERSSRALVGRASAESVLRALVVSPEVRPGTAADLIAAYRAEVLLEAADGLVAACPEHSDADEVWMDCHCDVADELRAKATLTEGGGAG